MHELTIARGIVEAAIHEAGMHEAKAITALRCRIGVLRVVDRSLLEAAFEAAAENSPAARARLRVDVAPIRLSCHGCGWSGERGGLEFECPACGGDDVEWAGGDEMELVSIDVEVDDEHRDSATEPVRDQLVGCR